MTTKEIHDLPVQIIKANGGPPLAVIPLPVLLALVGLARERIEVAKSKLRSPKRESEEEVLGRVFRMWRINYTKRAEEQLVSILREGQAAFEAQVKNVLESSNVSDRDVDFVFAPHHAGPAVVGEVNARRLEDEETADRAAYLETKARDEETLPHAVVKRLVAGEHPVKVFREHRSLTQAELAERAGSRAAYISQIETGKREGSKAMLRKLANALDVELADLLE